MKLKGLLGIHEVIFIIDLGATHNVILSGTVSRARIEVTALVGF